MAEKFLRTLLLMFISSCYLIYNARRDKKESVIVIQTADNTGARSSTEFQEKRSGRKK